MLPKEIAEIVTDLLPAHDAEAVTRALSRATRFGRFKAVDVRSILAIGPAAPEPAAAGDAVVVDLPTAEVRSFDAYRIERPGMSPRTTAAALPADLEAGLKRLKLSTIRRQGTRGAAHRQDTTLDTRRDAAGARRRSRSPHVTSRTAATG